MKQPIALALIALALAFGPAAEAQVRVVRPAAVRAFSAPATPYSAARLSAARVSPTSVRVAPAQTNVAPAATPSPSPTPSPGVARCEVRQNGASAPGTLTVRTYAGTVVAEGPCTDALTVPAGRYVATVRLNHTLDHASRSMVLNVPAGGVALARADIATSILEVRISDREGFGYGRATITRDGALVGTTDSEIPVTLSPGRYTVEVTYRRETRTYAIDLVAGGRRAIYARFL